MPTQRNKDAGAAQQSTGNAGAFAKKQFDADAIALARADVERLRNRTRPDRTKMRTAAAVEIATRILAVRPDATHLRLGYSFDDDYPWLAESLTTTEQTDGYEPGDEVYVDDYPDLAAALEDALAELPGQDEAYRMSEPWLTVDTERETRNPDILIDLRAAADLVVFKRRPHTSPA